MQVAWRSFWVGDVAQLGERRNGIAEVVGSTPIVSTKFTAMVTVYVLQGRTTAKRYVGITNSLERRLSEHRSGLTKSGQIIGYFDLIHTETFPDHTTARVREKFLKSGAGREWLKARYPRSWSATGG